MMSAEQNELITGVGPGTKCGALMRHYWHPVALADELADERPAKAVRVLGQDFVLFRDERGRLRPARPRLPASRRRPRLRPARGWRPALPVPRLAVRRRRQVPGDAGRARGQRALPARAPARLSGAWCKNGIIFAYLGEGEAPAFPDFDCFLAPGTHAFAFKGLIDCNWLQALEVGIDPAHASYLHRFYEDEDPSATPTASSSAPPPPIRDIPMTRMMREFTRPDASTSRAPTTACACSPCASSATKHTHVRVTNLVFPYAFVIPMSAEMTITQWHVPIDDTPATGTRSSPASASRSTRPAMREQRLKLYELPDYRPRIGRHNNYGYDVAEQASQTFTGMGFDINVHDQWAIESQGRIQDRTREHLGTTDKAIVAYRRMLLSAIGQVAQRREAADVARRRRAPRPCRGPVTIDGMGPTEGWEALLEGGRPPPPRRRELGPAGRGRRAGAGWLRGLSRSHTDGSAGPRPRDLDGTHMSTSSRRGLWTRRSARRRARCWSARRRRASPSCASPSPTSTACCAARH